MKAFLLRKAGNLVRDRNFWEVFTGSVWTLAAKVLAAGLGLVIGVIIARRYGAVMMGVVAVIDSFLTLATVLTLLGTNISILRLIPEHLSRRSLFSAFLVYRKILYIVIVASMAAAMLFYFGAGFVARKFFSKPHLEFYFSLAALFVVFKSMTILLTETVRGMKLIRLFAFMQVLPAGCVVALLLLLSCIRPASDVPVYAMLGGTLLAAIAGLGLTEFGFKDRGRPDGSAGLSLREIFSISLPMLMANAMSFLIGQTGIVMLGIFRSEAEVGFYAVAVKLANLTTFMLSAINSMAAPKFSELFHAGKIDDLFQVARQSAKLIFWTTTPIIIGLVVFGKFFLDLVFGQEFAIAYPPLLLLTLGQFVNAISGSTGFFLNMTGRQDVLRNIMFSAAFLNVALSLLFIPQIGIMGAALASMICLIFWNVMALVYIHSKFGRNTGYLPGRVGRFLRLG